MQLRAFTCQCSNIKIRGQPLPPKVIPNVPKSESRFLASCHSLRIIYQKSIEIKDLSCVTGNALSNFCCELHCNKCKTHFRILIGRGIFYIGKINEESGGIQGKSKLPNAILPLIVQHAGLNKTLEAEKQPKNTNNEKNDNLQQISEDADFDLMFSNQDDLIVGSYKQNMEVPADVAFGPFCCEFAPKTYFK